MSPEVRQMIAKIQSSQVNPKSVPGLLLAIMIKLSQATDRKNTVDVDKVREELTRSECLSKLYQG